MAKGIKWSRQGWPLRFGSFLSRTHGCDKSSFPRRLWKFTKKAVQISRHPQCFADFRRTIDTCLVELGTTHRPKIDRLMTLIFQTFGNVSMLGK